MMGQRLPLIAAAGALTGLLGLGCRAKVQTAVPTAIASPSHPIRIVANQATIQQQSHPLLKQIQAFTVKLMTPHSQGSGVIIRHRSGHYWVITSDHTIMGTDPITIRTIDGRHHRAHRRFTPGFEFLDLALLEFLSDNPYPVASLAPGLTVSDSSPILAAGFPYEVNGNLFKMTDGRVSHITARGFNGGYRIGYSNWVRKGMSGGPVVNLQGQVIAINGLHAEPLWGNPYIWDDGTPLPEKSFEQFAALSWAIPSETIIRGLGSAALGGTSMGGTSNRWMEQKTVH